MLQNLVPNGTKVSSNCNMETKIYKLSKVQQKILSFGSNVKLQIDISTMLEEAAQYVKFLQLQIKVMTQKNIF